MKLKSKSADKGIISVSEGLVLCNFEGSLFMIIADNENFVLKNRFNYSWIYEF